MKVHQHISRFGRARLAGRQHKSVSDGLFHLPRDWYRELNEQTDFELDTVEFEGGTVEFRLCYNHD